MIFVMCNFCAFSVQYLRILREKVQKDYTYVVQAVEVKYRVVGCALAHPSGCEIPEDVTLENIKKEKPKKVSPGLGYRDSNPNRPIQSRQSYH